VAPFVHFNPDAQGVLINIKSRMPAREMRLFGRVARTEEIESAGHPGEKFRKVFTGK